MKTNELQSVLTWVKGTDLVEVSYKAGKDGFAFATTEAQPTPNYPIPAPQFTPVTSPAVGLFQFSALGKARKAEEGVDVAEGDALGIVEAGKTKTEVKAPCAGRVARVFAEGGQAVGYGDVLMFLQPR